MTLITDIERERRRKQSIAQTRRWQNKKFRAHMLKKQRPLGLRSYPDRA